MLRVLFPLFALVFVLGCKEPASTESIANAATPAPPAASTIKPQVVRIVFVGKEQACDCTRKAIDAGWSALQGALAAQKSQLPIERIQIDVDGKKVETYKAKRAFVALPAIYFFSAADGLVELLQGEITEAQVRAILQ